MRLEFDLTDAQYEYLERIVASEAQAAEPALAFPAGTARQDRWGPAQDILYALRDAHTEARRKASA